MTNFPTYNRPSISAPKKSESGDKDLQKSQILKNLDPSGVSPPWGKSWSVFMHNEIRKYFGQNWHHQLEPCHTEFLSTWIVCLSGVVARHFDRSSNPLLSVCKKSLKDCTLLKDSNSHQTKCFTRISVLQTWIRLTHSFVRRGICQMFYVSKIPIILSSYSFTQADFVTLVTNFTSVFVNILILKHDVLQVFYIGFPCCFHSCFSQKDLLF